MIRIAHFIYDNPANPWVAGGGAVRNLEIYSRFGQEFDVTIYSGDYQGSVEKITSKNFRQTFLGKKVSSYAASRFWFALEARKFLKKESDRFDLVVEDYSPFSPTGAATFLPPHRYVCQSQNYFGLSNHLRKLGPFGFLTSSMENAYYNRCKNIIFSSRDLAEVICTGAKMEFRDGSHTVIPYGVPAEILSSRRRYTKKKQVLFVGRFEIHQKGLDTLFDHLKTIGFRETGLTLILAGSGKDESALMKIVEKSGLKSCVKLVGRISGERKIRIISESLFTLIPSRYESWGIVSVESQACGTPVLATDIPGLRQTLIREKTGLLYRDFKSFRSSFTRLLEDGKMRERMSKAGRVFAKSFSWDKLALEQARYYRKVLQER